MENKKIAQAILNVLIEHQVSAKEAIDILYMVQSAVHQTAIIPVGATIKASDDIIVDMMASQLMNSR